jgi:CspA family cold shock protein
MAEGVVKRYNAEKGFGFIEPDGGGSEIFVHATGVTEGVTLLAGQRVRYIEQRSRRHSHNMLWSAGAWY